MQIVTRKEALSQGLKRYFTGKLCKNRHVSERYTDGGHCIQCMKIKNQAYQLAHPEKARERDAKHRKLHPEKARQSDAKWRAANREKHLAKGRAWRAANREKISQYNKLWKASNFEKKNAITTAWRIANPERVRSHVAKRRAAKLERTPPWADLDAIKAFYLACPKGHHVDHHYPLQGEICSGLHVIENLRYLPAHENLSKGNRMPEDQHPQEL